MEYEQQLLAALFEKNNTIKQLLTERDLLRKQVTELEEQVRQLSAKKEKDK